MSLLNRRRALLSAKGKVLPYAYQQVEYLECSGTQYIDTGFYFKSEYDVNFTFLTDRSSGVTNPNCGLWTTCAFDIDPLWHYSSNFGGNGEPHIFGWKYYATAYTGITCWYNISPNEKYTVYTKGNRWYQPWAQFIDGGNTMPSGKIAPAPLLLFATTAGASANYILRVHNSSHLRFYDFKVLNGSEIVAEFIPCYRKADGNTGMYDIVNNKFCQNSGTGEFILGGEV